MSYPFPGNVRELENIIAAAVVTEGGNALTLASAPALMSFSESTRIQSDRMLSLDEVEKHHIYKVLETSDGNRTRAAEILGIGLRTLQRKLKAFNRSESTPK